MLKFFSISTAAILCLGLTMANAKTAKKGNAMGVHKEKINDIGGKPMDLSAYKGKTVLFVNIATKCGYTPQLKGLEALYNAHKAKGLVVVGIPSNDFGGQTPENNDGVKKFCMLNYGVTFPLTEKAVVKGEKTHPLVKNLIAQSSNKAEIGWNFEKFLVDKNGKLVERYSSSIKPEDKQLVDKIASIL